MADSPEREHRVEVVVDGDNPPPPWHPEYVPPSPTYPAPPWHPEAGEPPDEGGPPDGGVREPRRPAPQTPDDSAEASSEAD